MPTMTRILYKDLEISNDCDDFEWEQAHDIAKEVVDSLDSSYRVMFTVAGNVDWRGRSGFKIDPIPDADDLWSKVAGWERADWTLRVEVVKPTLIRATAYSHDTPTGGSRIVKFLNGNGMYALMRNNGWKKKDIVQQLNDWGYSEGTMTIEQIKDVLEYEISMDEIMTILGS